MENDTSEIFFGKFAKVEGEGGRGAGEGSENSRKNPLSQTKCICGWPLKVFKMNQSVYIANHTYQFS